MTDRPTSSPAPAGQDADSCASQPPAEPATIAPGEVQTHLPEAAGELRAGTVPAQFPAQFGRYRLEKLLGKGGMGAVYLAHDTQLDRPVALKVPKFGPEDAGLRERFFREARAAATLQHPNLCPVFDVAEQDGAHYLTMAYIDGKPLASYIRADKLLAPEQAAGLVRVLAKALQEAHEHGIIHRDLKPANIMINKKKQPVIMDFGLARRAGSQDEKLTQSGAVFGTPAYMAPEQVNGDIRAMGPATDVYALGVIFYELLTGGRPFEGALGSLLAQIVADPPKPPGQLRPGLDPALEAICLKALAKQPADRFASMRDFADALQGWLEGTPSVKPMGTAPRPAAPSPGGSKTLPGPASSTGSLPSTTAPKPRVVAVVPTVLAEHKPSPPSPQRRGKQRGQRSRVLSPGKRWVLFVAVLFSVTCVLPVGLIVLVVQKMFHEFSHGVAKASQMFVDQQREQQKLRDEQKKEEDKLEEAARAWQPLPADADPTRLFPATIGKYQRVATDDKAQAPDLNVMMSGRRAMYQGASSSLEIFAYRANELEKAGLYHQVIDTLTRRSGMPDFTHLPSIRGTAQGKYLIFERGAATGAAAEQHGVLWWSGGWLFLIRGSAAREPAAFLNDYLEAVHGDVSGKKNESP